MTLVKQEYETDAKYIVLKSKQSDSNIMTYMDHIISVFQSDFPAESTTGSSRYNIWSLNSNTFLAFGVKIHNARKCHDGKQCLRT